MKTEISADAIDELAGYRALVACARSFERAMDLNSLIDEIIDRSADIMRAEAASIFLPDIKTGELILYSTHPNIRSLGKEVRIPKGKGIAGAVFESKQALNIKDAKKDPRHFRTVDKTAAFNTRAILCVPLLNGGECMGVMQALNPLDRPHFSDQNIELFEDFGVLIVNTLVRLDIQKQEIERARSQQELHLAREIQMSYMPVGIQAFEDCKVHFSYLPASDVGGDFYFAHPAGGGKLLLGLGDASGKGIPAALTMARATAIIRAQANEAINDLGQWMTQLNKEISLDLKAGQFIGLTVMLIDRSTSLAQVCTAGQFAPVRYRRGRWLPIETPKQMPIGILDNTVYRANNTDLKAGDQFILFSDGLPEARNESGKEWGLEPFIASLPKGFNAFETNNKINETWNTHVGRASQHDDSTFLLLDWCGPRPEPVMQFDCCPGNLCHLRSFIEPWAIHAGLGDIKAGQVVTACDEAVSNVFRHAYQGKPGPVKVTVKLVNQSLWITVSDRAGEIDLKRVKGRDLEDLRPGGLGTVIMEKVFDDIQYLTDKQGTQLTLIKHISDSEAKAEILI